MSTCRGCSSPLKWGTRPNGKKIPLNLIAELEKLVESCGLQFVNPLPVSHRYFLKHGDAVQHPEGDYLSHFITCPERAKF